MILRQRRCHHVVVSAACVTQSTDVAGVVSHVSQTMSYSILKRFTDEESHVWSSGSTG